MKTCRAGLHVYEPGRGCKACNQAKATAQRRERYARDPEFKARVIRHATTSTQKRRAKDPTFVEASKEYQRTYHAKKQAEDPEYAKKRKQRMRELRSDPVFFEKERLRQLEYDRKRNADPAFQQRKRDYMRDRFRRPEVQAKHGVNHHKRRALLAGSDAPGVTLDQWAVVCAVYTRDGKTFCAYCKTCGPVTRDHIVPIARGGADEIANVLPACKRCNSSKRDRLITEWHRAPMLLNDRELSALREHTERCLASVRKKTSSTSSSERAPQPQG